MSRDIPKHFTNQGTSIRNFSDVKRTVHRVEPYNGQSFNSTSNRRILFKMPRMGILRGIRSFLRFDCVISGGSLNSAYEPFLRHRVKVGNVYHVDEREYGFYNITKLKALVKTGESNSASLKITGDGNTAADGETNEMCLPLANTLYDKRGYFSELLPLYKMDQIELEWEINDSIDQFTSGDATAVTINNIQLVLDIVDSPRLRASFGSVIKRGYESFDHQVRSLTASSSKISEILPSSYQNINHLLLIMRDSADVSVGTTGAHYYDNILKMNSINNMQAFLDGKPYPATPIKTNTSADGISGVENIRNLEECWGTQCLGSWHNYQDSNTSNRSYVGIPFAVERKTVSGLRTSNTSGNLLFKADVSNSNATQLDFFVNYVQFLEIAPSGASRISF